MRWPSTRTPPAVRRRSSPGSLSRPGPTYLSVEDVGGGRSRAGRPRIARATTVLRGHARRAEVECDPVGHLGEHPGVLAFDGLVGEEARRVDDGDGADGIGPGSTTEALVASIPSGTASSTPPSRWSRTRTSRCRSGRGADDPWEPGPSTAGHRGCRRAPRRRKLRWTASFRTDRVRPRDRRLPVCDARGRSRRLCP